MPPYRALPQRPSIEQLRKQAKDILRAHHTGDAAGCAALRRIARLRGLSDAELLLSPVSLSDAQFAQGDCQECCVLMNVVPSCCDRSTKAVASARRGRPDGSQFVVRPSAAVTECFGMCRSLNAARRTRR
jgi:hypothetical protein